MMRDLIGQQLGNYQLVRLLGRGGFAEVYLGQHVRLSKQAAIKVLHAHLLDEQIKGFEQEAKTIANLEHPHIVRVFNFDVSDGFPFLVMDYCPDGTLRKHHPKGECVPLPTVVTYIKQVADALQYAHDQKIIHRDVKPENMLIGRHNAILISDFGIATAAHSTHSMRTENFAGTAAYMAPEQIKRHPRRQSDQYALAVVTYEWLTGELPFIGIPEEIVIKHLVVEPPSLCQRVPHLSQSVEEVVMKALAKDPKERFADVQAFAAALEQASWSGRGQLFVLPKKVTVLSQSEQSQSSVPLLEATSSKQSHSPTILATPLHPFSQPTRQIPPQNHPAHAPEVSDTQQPIPQLTGRFSRRAVIAGLVGLTLVGGGITWFAISRSPSKPVPHADPTLTPLPIGTLLFTYQGHSSSVSAVAWSPDGKRIASASEDKTVQVWDAVDGRNAFVYRGHSAVVYAVAWSPDGKRIASASEDKTVQVWDAADGGHVFTYRGHSNGVYAIAWSPDGKRIASGSVGTVQVWDAVDGGNAFTYQGHHGGVLAVAWSPNGKRIASGSWEDIVQVWDAVDGGNAFTYQGHSNTTVYAVAWSPDGKRIASGADDDTVQIWDAVDGRNAFTYKGHSHKVLAVAWSSDGKRITSGSYDRTVQVWDAVDGGHVFTYRGHSDGVYAVAWSPNGKRIVSGSGDHTVQVWVAS